MSSETSRRCLKLVQSERHGSWVSVRLVVSAIYSEVEDYLGRCRSGINRAEAKHKRLSKKARRATRDRVKRALSAAEWRWGARVLGVFAI